MKKTIYLHGHLRKLYSDPIVVEADSVAEAVRSLELIPELRPKDGQPHPVTIAGVENEVHLFAKRGECDIHIHPVTGGSGGKGGLFQVLLGITLIALSFVIPTAGLFGIEALSASNFFLAGAMMALGGIVQLLTPTPDMESEEGSKYIAGSVNTTRIGTRIPILYGQRRLFGHYLTFDVDAKSVNTGTTTGSVQGVPFTDDPAMVARWGYPPYDTGQFSYVFWEPNSVGDAQGFNGVFPPDPEGWTQFARGYTSAIQPGTLWETIRNYSTDKGFIARYNTWIRPVATGVHNVVVSGPEATGYVIKDFNGVDVTGASLTAGQLYEVEIYFIRSFTIMLGASYSAQIQSPGGSMLNLETTPILEDYNTTAPTTPPDITVEQNAYITYDETPLADGITPVRPIFASNVRGPGNIPTAGWTP